MSSVINVTLLYIIYCFVYSFHILYIPPLRVSMKGSCLYSSREKLLLGSLTSATYLAADCTPNKKFSTTATKRISYDGMKHRLYVDNKTINPVGTSGIEFLISAITGNMKYIIGNINIYFYWKRNILRILDSYRILILQGELKLSYLIHFYFFMRLHLEKISNKMKKFLISFSLAQKTLR